jgi:hypothetical protein
MKIESRSEKNKQRLGRYKTHEVTPSFEGADMFFVSGAYIPTSDCPPDEKPIFHIVLGMDYRRYVFSLSFEEAVNLKNELDTHLARLKPHIVPKVNG